MAAPEGNQFWKIRSKHGRDTLFSSPEAMWEAACEYFDWCDKNPLYEEVVSFYQGIPNHDMVAKKRVYTLSGLCLYMGCGESYFRSFDPSKSDRYEDFLTVLDQIKTTIRDQKYTGAAAGLFNAGLITRDLGLTESIKTDHTSSDGSMSPTKIVITGPDDNSKD